MWRGTMQAVRSMQFGRRRRWSTGATSSSRRPGHLGLIALVLPWEGAAAHAELMARARHFAPLIAITRDGGEGRIRLTRAGRVRIDYRLDASGIATARHALVSMARLARAGGAREILAVGMPHAAASRRRGGDEARRFAAFEAAAGRDRTSGRTAGRVSAHQMGTIRLGADPRTIRPTRAAGLRRDRAAGRPGPLRRRHLDVPHGGRGQPDGRRDGDGAAGQPDGARRGEGLSSRPPAGTRGCRPRRTPRVPSAPWRAGRDGDDDRDRGEDHAGRRRSCAARSARAGTRCRGPPRRPGSRTRTSRPATAARSAAARRTTVNATHAADEHEVDDRDDRGRRDRLGMERRRLTGDHATRSR